MSFVIQSSCERAKVTASRNGESFCTQCGCDFQEIIDRTPDDTKEEVEGRLRQAFSGQDAG